MPSATPHQQAKHLLLALALVLSFIGLAKPVLFQEGSAIAKYIVKQQEMQQSQENETEDYMNSLLFNDATEEAPQEFNPREDSVYTATESLRQIDKFLFLLVALIGLYPLVPKLREKEKLAYFLFLPATWLMLHAIAIGLNAGKSFSDLAFFAHATRWGAPLALFCLLHRSKRIKTKLSYILISCCSLTFFTHGWEALQLNASFIDLIYLNAQNIKLNLSLKNIHIMLYFIGTMDIFLALFLLFKRSPRLLLWMTFWGLLTALSRSLALGLNHGWQETFIRAANPILPLVLYFLISPKLKHGTDHE